MKINSNAGLSPNGPVKSASTPVPGRTRLEVVGLYRSRELGDKLEKALLDLEGIHSAKANILTGRLLVVYATDISFADIVGAVERSGNWIHRPQPSTESDSGTPKSPGTKRQVALASLLQRFSSLLTEGPTPAFAATAGFQQSPLSMEVKQQIHPWHVMDPGQVVGTLKVAERTGLSAAQAAERLRLYGANVLEASEKRSDISIFIGQFNSLPVGLLGISAVISVMTGGAVDAAVILGVVLINSVIGFVTERQAEKTINSLSDTGVRSVRGLRDGIEVEIAVDQVVPGDVLLLTPGSYIAADLRLLRSHRLSIDESALTGESMPVSKNHEYIAKDDVALGDRVNMSYMGTHVTGGSGQGIVVATAKVTELGQIQTMVGEAESPETPMQKSLDKMGTQLALLSGGVCAGVFGVGMVRGFGWMEMLKSSVSLAVAAVPEGLPAVATTTLAMGIKDMRQRNVAVRHLDAVESLGSVQVFCLDKTGTLTMNRMAVVSVFGGQETYSISENRFLNDGKPVNPGKREELVRLMEVVSLCSESELGDGSKETVTEGSATENALVELAINSGISVRALRAKRPKLKTRYRAEGRPYMTTLHSSAEGKPLLAVKGSPEEVLGLCTHELKGSELVPLTNEARQDILAANDRMAGNALRVLGAAYRELDEERLPSRTGKLVWLGLAGMADPMRPGMDKLMAQYHRAGIQTVMITGDQSATAAAIGAQLGLSHGRPLQVLESSKLDEMDPELLAGLVKNVHVFARVSPAHKLKIVRALQEAGYVVAMTGDGINDGPALKAADIGVAMGKTGTDIARSVSDVVLEDDNLHTMEVAVRQGRTIYNNIRKTIHFMVSTNLTEIEVMLAGITFGMGQPMNPMQLLWINLVTDIFPGLALSLEPAEPGIMDRPPRDPNEPIITRTDLKRMFFESGIIGVGTFAAFVYGLRRYGPGAPQAATMAFTSLTVNELAHALSSRSHYRMLMSRRRLPPNRHLNRAIIAMLAAQAVATWVPGVRRLLGTTPLNLVDLLVVGLSVLGPLLVNEFTKPTMPANPEQEGDVSSSDTTVATYSQEQEQAA